MQAIRIHETGDFDRLIWESVPDPVPGPGEVLVEIRAAGVNYMDIYGRRGLNPVTLPWIPGGEGAGIIRSLNDRSDRWSVGDRVAFCGVGGTYAEKVVVPLDKLIPIPPQMDFETAAAVLLQGMTAHYLIHDTYPVKSGDTILFHAGAGGVGLLATQMAKRVGATVLTTVSSPEKSRWSTNAGADAVIRYTEEDFLERVMEYTSGRGVQAVYDSVGASTFESSLKCLAVRGFLVLFGNSSGPVPPFDLRRLSARSTYVTRPGLPNYTSTRDQLLNRAEAVFGGIIRGILKLHRMETFPLKEAGEAQRRLENRETTGKLILVP